MKKAPPKRGFLEKPETFGANIRREFNATTLRHDQNAPTTIALMKTSDVQIAATLSFEVQSEPKITLIQCPSMNG
ncbi:hypothetical protein [Microvirga pudoricolor]|uniref:hypothetical protein n=1 Tax=Microvirga pudoricolor TaxID=2778729 RepID=UPI00195023E8|nr:hypothetical protein [Microvirga pudoricolor]MBM6592772.1 hypothetical protein [Microvirga pudoricolor]